MRFLFPMCLMGSLVATAAVVPQAPAPPPAPPPLTCEGPEYRQFDFWLGTWDVVPNPATAPPRGVPAGQPPATNIVSRAHGGCVLIENWTTPNQTGQSLNIYDRASGRWHQTWVDSHGGLHEYWGGLENGRMVFLGQVPLSAAVPVAGRRTVRLSFTPLADGRVRQLAEGLAADGSWSVNYDLIYSRRQAAP